MHEERIQTLREYAERHCPLDRASGICGCIDARNAADAIEELQAGEKKFLRNISALEMKNENLKRAGRWIPVTERLPDCQQGAEVGNIEWVIHGRVYAGCFGRGGIYRDAYFRTWTDGTEGIDAKDADYWRAVSPPEPPKEGET